jgi:hypothetical protein
MMGIFYIICYCFIIFSVYASYLLVCNKVELKGYNRQSPQTANYQQTRINLLAKRFEKWFWFSRRIRRISSSGGSGSGAKEAGAGALSNGP